MFDIRLLCFSLSFFSNCSWVWVWILMADVVEEGREGREMMRVERRGDDEALAFVLLSGF